MKTTTHAWSAVFLPLTLLSLFLFSSCGSSGSASGPAPQSSMPVAVEFLDGASGVDATSSFQQTFTEEMDSSTISGSTFFIVLGSSANIAVPPAKAFSSACDAASALPAPITASTDKTTYTLTPTSTLTYSATYTICLTEEIKYASGASFTAFSVTFTTAAEGAASSMFISSIAPLGNDIDLSLFPITAAFTNALDETAFALNTPLTVIGDRTGTVEGTWAITDTAKKTVQFTPQTEPICDRISFDVLAGVLDVDGGSLATGASSTFTTRFYYDSNFTDSTLQSNFTTCWTKQTGTSLITDTFTTNGLTFTLPPPNEINRDNMTESWYKEINNTSFAVTFKNVSMTLEYEANTGSTTGLAVIIGDSLSLNSSIVLLLLIYNDPGTAQYILQQTSPAIEEKGNSGDFAVTKTNNIYTIENVSLRLTRRDQSFAAYYSTNGTDFTQLGNALTIPNIGTNGANFLVDMVPISIPGTRTKDFTMTIGSVDFSLSE